MFENEGSLAVVMPKISWFCRFEKDLAAEALRRNENDSQKALDDLTNPEINSSIQVPWSSLRWFNFIP